MNHDQADELRHLVRQRISAGVRAGFAVPLVVLSGGKGGVGTTTTAANLAIALARQGRRTVLVDADLDHGGNAHWGQHPPSGSVVDVLAGRRTVHEVLERGPSGIQVLSGDWASGESAESSAAAQERFVADLKNLGPHAEVVVIDAGSSRKAFVRRMWNCANIVLVVTTTEPSSITECYAAIKVLMSPDRPTQIGTLINRSPDPWVAGEVQTRITDACRRFLGLHVVGAGEIPSCEPAGAIEPVSIYPPRSASARALDRAAEVLWAQLQLEAAGEPRGPSAKSA
jgi:flagellar biosynthesis protein FlhG